MSKNSVLDGLKSNLLEFIQESMSEKVLESISSEGSQLLIRISIFQGSAE